jgi:hypothetical protein
MGRWIQIFHQKLFVSFIKKSQIATDIPSKIVSKFHQKISNGDTPPKIVSKFHQKT